MEKKSHPAGMAFFMVAIYLSKEEVNLHIASGYVILMSHIK
jgi:hypothetical protein